MRWDVVEVIPEPGYCLFVRFKDGLNGRVRLRLEELTVALTPLRNVPFFKRAYIDYGAVAWPGDIDLAPDEMHAHVARERERARNAHPEESGSPIGSTLPASGPQADFRGVTKPSTMEARTHPSATSARRCY